MDELAPREAGFRVRGLGLKVSGSRFRAYLEVQGLGLTWRVHGTLVSPCIWGYNPVHYSA